MATSPRQQYEKERDRLTDAHDEGRISTADHDAILECLDGRDETALAQPSRGVKTTDSGHSLRSYTNTLHKVAERLDGDLTDADADDVNQLMSDHLTGRHPDVKDDGLAESTLSSYQGILRTFFQYHDDLGVDPTDVEVMNPGRTPVDEHKIFDPDEVEDMRAEVDNPRDRALFELLVNTGQRIGALQSLRVKDMRPDEGVFYLNPDGGLKGADENGKKRPLLGAKRAVHDWLKDHPTKNPDDYLLTNLPSWSRGPNAGEMLSQQSLNRILKRIAESAGIDRSRVHAHTFRHTFVTIAKRDYDMDDATIKHIIGHKPDSTVMETTYAHLTNDDHIQAAEVAAGMAEPTDDSPLTPAVCPTCGDHLADDAKACAGCGMVFAPDAKSAEKQIQADVKQDYRDTEPGDDEQQGKIDALDDLLNDPEVKAALLDRMEEDE